MRPPVVLACLLAVGVFPAGTVAAQHAKEPVAAKPDAKSPEKPDGKSAEKPDAAKEPQKAGSDRKEPAAAKAAPRTELEAALQRINQRLDAGASAPAQRRPEPRATRPAAESVPRIRLTWRTTLVWPDELDKP